MRSFWSEPFLWIHLAGLAVLPLSLQAILLGFAIGTPIFPFWLELLGVGIVGIVPIVLMQWSRPFDIFSLLLVSLRPDALTLEQQKILSLFKRKQQRFLALLSAVLMALLLWQLYQWSPLAVMAASIFPQWRILGLAIASVAFLMTNLFFQVPMSVLGVLLTGQEQFTTQEPLSPEQIRQSFTIPGLRVKKILPTPESDLN